MLNKFLLQTIRRLWQNKTYSTLNILGLATGIASAAFIFLWIEDEVNYDGSYPKKDRLYQVLTQGSFEGKKTVFPASSGPWAAAMKAEIPGVANASRVKQYSYLFSIDDKAIYENCNLVDPAFFSMFSLQFLQGNANNAFKELYSVVLTEKMAKQFFGSAENANGKSLKMENDKSYLVSGVIKDIPNNSTLQFNCLIPFEHFAIKRSATINNWNTGYLDTYVELSPDADVSRVNRLLYDFVERKDAKAAGLHPILFSMNDWRLRANFEDGKQTGGRIVYVRMFGFIAAIILFIACINFMNLSTARSEKRAREVGVRKVMGAGRRMLILQFIGEAICMALLAVLTGLFFVALLMPAFNTLVEKQLTPGLDKPLHFLSLLGIALLCGLVAGSYPAFYLSSFRPVLVLKSFKSMGGSVAWIRKSLVVFQFSVSIMLIVASIIIYKQIQYVKDRDLGYKKDNLVLIDMHGDLKLHFDAVRQDLLNTGLVANAGMCSNEILFEGNNRPDYTWEGKDPSKQVTVSFRDISSGFVGTWGLQLIDGRDFYTGTDADSNNVIITESLARLMGNGSAIGKTIREKTRTWYVTGVVKDIVYGKMYATNSDPVMFRYKPRSAEQLIIKVKKDAPLQEAINKISAVMKKDNPAYPFEYSFVDEQLNQFYKAEILIGRLAGVFATLAIIISCLGLFGLATYTAERRAKEISIRKVLGSSAAGITGLLTKDFLYPIFFAALIGFPVAWLYMNEWLQNFAYRIDISWWYFGVAVILVVFIALFTISFQSIRAALANPVKNLRAE